MSNEPPELDRNVLPYAPRSTGGKSIGVQAFLGALVTLIIIVAIVVALGLFSLNMQNNIALFMMFGLAAVIILVVAVRAARTQHRYPDRRGWGIGIYIGLGLGALFWGYCGIGMYSLNHMH
jgi:hypothetical protein